MDATERELTRIEHDLAQMRAERAAWESEVASYLVAEGWSQRQATNAARSATDHEHEQFANWPAGFARTWATGPDAQPER